MRLNFMCFWVLCGQCKDKDSCDIDWDKVRTSASKANNSPEADFTQGGV